MTKFLYIPTLLVALVVWSACQDQTPKAPQAATPPVPTTGSAPADTAWVVVSEHTAITLFGHKVALEEMKKGLQDSMAKLTVIPDRIPLRFEGEVLMGMRGEVGSLTMEAIAAARASQHPPVTEALRISVEKALTVPVQFDITDFRIFENYAYVAANLQQPDGKPVDYTKTPLKKRAASGDVSSNVFGLLKMENDTWKVITQSIGPSDMPVICWWKEFKVPKAVFSPGIIVEDCK